MQIIPKK